MVFKMVFDCCDHIAFWKFSRVSRILKINYTWFFRILLYSFNFILEKKIWLLRNQNWIVKKYYVKCVESYSLSQKTKIKSKYVCLLFPFFFLRGVRGGGIKGYEIWLVALKVILHRNFYFIKRFHKIGRWLENVAVVIIDFSVNLMESLPRQRPVQNY